MNILHTAKYLSILSIALIGAATINVAAPSHAQAETPAHILFVLANEDSSMQVSHQISGFESSISFDDTVDYIIFDDPDEDYGLSKTRYDGEIEALTTSKNEYSAVVAVGERALELVSADAEEVFDDTPIFFMNIPQDSEILAQVSEDVAGGMTTALTVTETLQFAKAIQPDAKRFIAVTDSAQGTDWSDELQMVSEISPTLPYEVLDVATMTTEEIASFVGDLDPKNDILVLLECYRDGSGVEYTIPEAYSFLNAASSVPVYGMDEAGVDKGLGAGYINLQDSQGAGVAHMMDDATDNNALSDSHITQTSPTLIFDDTIMDSFGLDVPDLYKEEATIVNVSSAPAPDQGNLVYALIVFGVALILAGVITIFRATNEKKKLRFELAECHENNQVIDNFLSRLSYGLRTDMNSVIGLCDLSQDEAVESPVKEYLKQIRKSGMYVMELVDDIQVLELSGASHSVVRDEPIDYRSLVNDLLERMNAQATGKGVRFIDKIHIDAPYRFQMFDRVRMYTSLKEILDNAINFTEPGGFVRWSVTFAEDSDGNGIIRHEVQDDGVGMSKKFQQHMYEPFRREPNDSLDLVEGNGIGLAVAKNFVESLGGTIDITSQLRGGTRVVIEYPAHTITHEAYVHALERAAGLHDNEECLLGLNVLVCEDNIISARITRKILESNGATVVMAADGGEGVEAFSQDEFDIVLMDIHMPTMDGYEAARNMKRIDSSVPIVSLSADTSPLNMHKLQDAGIQNQIAKPINTDELLGTIIKMTANQSWR